MFKFILVLVTLSVTVYAFPSGQSLSLDHQLLTGNFKIGEALKSVGQLDNDGVQQKIDRYLNMAKDEATVNRLYNDFKVHHQKANQNQEEEVTRMQLFSARLSMVLENNVKALHQQSGYILAINFYSDQTLEQALERPGGHWPQTSALFNSSMVGDNYVDSWIFDPFRQHHQVAPIQNQGSCGSCVYFAAAAAIESYWARKGHNLEVLSPQQLNDCAHDEKRGNHGCQHGGGTFVPTFDYIQKHGLTSMHNYPYKAKDENCDHNKEGQKVAHINSWHHVPSGNEHELMTSVEKNGPNAVAFHVSDGVMHYKSGIFDGECKGGRNHAVTVIGYGYEAHLNQNYWILKNHWGTGWGEHGFFRIRRDHGNLCDVAGDAVYVQ